MLAGGIEGAGRDPYAVSISPVCYLDVHRFEGPEADTCEVIHGIVNDDLYVEFMEIKELEKKGGSNYYGGGKCQTKPYKGEYGGYFPARDEDFVNNGPLRLLKDLTEGKGILFTSQTQQLVNVTPEAKLALLRLEQNDCNQTRRFMSSLKEVFFDLSRDGLRALWTALKYKHI